MIKIFLWFYESRLLKFFYLFLTIKFNIWIYFCSFNIIIIILFSIRFSILLFGKVNMYICVRRKWSADTRCLSGIDFLPDDFQRSPTNCAQHMPCHTQDSLHVNVHGISWSESFQKNQSLYAWPNLFKAYKRAFPYILSNKKFFFLLYWFWNQNM